ncbi:Asp-tRNA(Asn)/Glu-tRNA(Gln) amidotransferase GatCAB subunit B [Lottiidibacillus patelloidae]|uniref:Aspartyl/glutamyl-tRNA(Asn/Gln) amidotransferase subunit B n=1 Tax=Lottiidibacillus patelloidae TaxID=2670334 RepID=A0A263BTG5_9BACI|nr:Asp-tRNA(Asn)/Glu-tRNA(Gln) amidotransferase subunit GatB [Lottiidibacillus patelloidae]OZM56862.1 Asp-tRNA(Asn)/Glu-tRNA(Gln) amidotransferase GatCAB subunit B [Lottiidibacillus patelloidae]
MTFETVIGLEVHVELKTKSKMFCSCPVAFGAIANTNTCPICLGHPGTLPTVNKQAIDYAMRAGLALNCTIAQETKFDRKNYFYPDNPKAYQISQYDKPIAENGYLDIEVNGEKKRIGITRLHMEEDAGKLIHTESETLVDFNRAGTPLIEIVSEPDMRSPEEAYAYLEKLKSILQFTGVSDCKMEQGSLRCDANISLREHGGTTFGTKIELKNLNSFHHVKKALVYEQNRQAEILRSGKRLQQETRRYNEATDETVLMRIKEGADDYRYFREPDLGRIFIDELWLNQIQEQLPELPESRKKRYINELKLSPYDAEMLTLSKDISDFFEQILSFEVTPKQAANWLMGEVSAYLNNHQLDLAQTKLTPENLAALILLIEDGTISSKIAKEILPEVIGKGKNPMQVVQEKGLVQINDENQLREIVLHVLHENEQSIIDFNNGKDRALGYLVGQVMKQTKGKANPPLVNQMIISEIEKTNHTS